MSYLGQIAALTAAFFWSGTAILFSAAGKRMGALATNLLRILLGSLLLCITLWVTTGRFYPVQATAMQMKWLAVSGIVGLSIGDGALFVCLVILGPRIATLLLSLAPTITTLIAWLFLHEELGVWPILGIVLTLSGIYWVVMEDHDDPVHGSKTVGLILGVIAALGQGIGIIFAKKALSTDIDALSATVLRMVPATIVLWLYALLFGKVKQVFTTLRDRRASLALVGGSVFGPFLGIWLSIVAVKYTQTGIAATLLATVPIMIIPVNYIVYKIKPSPRTWVGTLMAVGGVALLFLRA